MSAILEDAVEPSSTVTQPGMWPNVRLRAGSTTEASAFYTIDQTKAVDTNGNGGDIIDKLGNTVLGSGSPDGAHFAFGWAGLYMSNVVATSQYPFLAGSTQPDTVPDGLFTFLSVPGVGYQTIRNELGVSPDSGFAEWSSDANPWTSNGLVVGQNLEIKCNTTLAIQHVRLSGFVTVYLVPINSTTQSVSFSVTAVITHNGVDTNYPTKVPMANSTVAIKSGGFTTCNFNYLCQPGLFAGDAVKLVLNVVNYDASANVTVAVFAAHLNIQAAQNN